MNDLQDLADKIVTMPGYVDATDPSDEAVDTWLNEDEQGPWVDVPHLEFTIWGSGNSMLARMEEAINTKERPFEPGVELTAAELDGCYLGRNLFAAGRDLISTRGEIRSDLNKLVPNVITTEERDELLLLARPDVPRWVNASWNFRPTLGDIKAARSLPTAAARGRAR